MAKLSRAKRGVNSCDSLYNSGHTRCITPGGPSLTPHVEVSPAAIAAFYIARSGPRHTLPPWMRCCMNRSRSHSDSVDGGGTETPFKSVFPTCRGAYRRCAS